MYICIDIGGTAVKYGLAAADGTLQAKGTLPTHAKEGGGPRIIRTVQQLIRDTLAVQPLEGIALSTAGMVDPIKGDVFYALPASIPDYTGTHWKALLTQEFHLPCAVENDVNCAALGELWLGAGKGCRSAFMITVGTSIGGCAIVDGHIVHGAGYSAGEIAYMRVPGGRLHELASATRLVHDVAKAKDVPAAGLNGRNVFALAEQDDAIAKAAIRHLIDHLADAICNVIAVLNPEIVILGGGIMARADVFGPRLTDALAKRLPEAMYQSTHLAFARLGNDAGMLGALYHL